MQELPHHNQNPLLQLISKGHNFWVRSQCENVGDLKLRLIGNNSDLLQGRVEGVKLKGEKINFKGLRFDHVEL